MSELDGWMGQSADGTYSAPVLPAYQIDNPSKAKSCSLLFHLRTGRSGRPILKCHWSRRGFWAIGAYMQCLPHLLDVSLDSLDGNCVIWNKLIMHFKITPPACRDKMNVPEATTQNPQFTNSNWLHVFLSILQKQQTCFLRTHQLKSVKSTAQDRPESIQPHCVDNNSHNII